VQTRQTFRAGGPPAQGPLDMASANTYPETACAYCGNSFTFGYNAEYCSQECVEKSRGESLLNLLKHDHRMCFGCFTKLKEVSRPTDEQLRQIDGKHSKEAVIGFQYQTEHADIGEITLRADTIDTVAQGTVCGKCGTTDHRDDFQRDFTPQEAAKRLRERIQETRAEGQHNYSFNTADFVEAWNDSKEWNLALGRAINE